LKFVSRIADNLRLRLESGTLPLSSSHPGEGDDMPDDTRPSDFAQSLPQAPSPTAPNFRHWSWHVVKWGLFVVVIAFVIRYGMKLWHDVDAEPVSIQWGWLVAAMFSSIVMWLPAMWFWRELLADLGPTPPWKQVIRAYYCGHPGKYVPGKAMVMIIRAALLKPSGISPATAALTVTLDSVTYITAGSVLTLLLLPWLLATIPKLAELGEVARQPTWLAGLVMTSVVAGLSAIALIARASVRLIRKFAALDPQKTLLGREVRIATLLKGFSVFLFGWWLQGLTLGLVLRGVSGTPIDWSDWPMWTGMSVITIAGGFIAVFAPGGLGVREGLLMEMLRNQVGPHEAVVAAVMLRAVTMVGELLAAGIVYFSISPPREPVGDPPA